MPPVKPAKAHPQAPEVKIDFPREGETLERGVYTVRLSAPRNRTVEACVDDGAWRACRFAHGYFWLDWNAAESGDHTVFARVTTSRSHHKPLAARRCRVA